MQGYVFSVELAARLLANGLMKPNALLTKLQKEKAALNAGDKINTAKDGRSRKATYYDHVLLIQHGGKTRNWGLPSRRKLSNATRQSSEYPVMGAERLSRFLFCMNQAMGKLCAPVLAQ